MEKLFIYLYGISGHRLRRIIRYLILKKERGEFYSAAIRKIYSRFHGIDIGLYSYGCFRHENINSLTRIGRYCSFAEGVCIFNGNHPLDYKSLHPFFYNPGLGYVETEQIKRRHIEIGNDVWIGRNAIITPSVKKVGNGAVIGAASVVTKDVPDFAVVAGNPAKIIKFRFNEETRNRILENPWWEKDIEELKSEIEHFTVSLETINDSAE